MLFYAETPSMVDLGRAERLFHIIGILLKSGERIGKEIVTCMLFTNVSNFTGEKQQNNKNQKNVSQQLMEMMSSHYKHIQGEGFWEEEERNNSDNKEQQHENKTTTTTSQQHKNPTLLETFSTVSVLFCVFKV